MFMKKNWNAAKKLSGKDTCPFPLNYLCWNQLVLSAATLILIAALVFLIFLAFLASFTLVFVWVLFRSILVIGYSVHIFIGFFHFSLLLKNILRTSCKTIRGKKRFTADNFLYLRIILVFCGWWSGTGGLKTGVPVLLKRHRSFKELKADRTCRDNFK